MVRCSHSQIFPADAMGVIAANTSGRYGRFVPAYVISALVSLVVAAFLVPTTLAQPLDIPIANGQDDGEELDNRIWNPGTSPLCIGRNGDGKVHDLGLRFLVPQLASVDSVLFARLRFSAHGAEIADELTFTVTGVLESNSPALSQERRPSQLPRTQSKIVSTVTEPWLDGGTTQLFYYTEDISDIINEILSLSGWGAASPALVICIDDSTPVGNPINYVMCWDHSPLRWPVSLQICRSLAETFICHEILGRPTDHSMTVSFTSLVSLEVYVEYGAWGLTNSTSPRTVPAGESCEIELTDLRINTDHSYHLRYRLANSEDDFAVGLEHSFRTQRPPGSSFTFTIQADSHIWESWGSDVPETDCLELYECVLSNIDADSPDFHISLGDFSMTEYSLTWQNSWDRYATQRRYLDKILHSIPFYLAIGNHEGELGYLMAEDDSVAVWAERARRALIPNPFPNDFYAGCPESAATGTGFRESYFSWEWGDALFVVLDPYWYTTSRPFHNPDPNDGGGWAWTLGQDQYDWLHQVLSESDRTWKIILLHHLVGGVENGVAAYGRGGVEVVKWDVAYKPTFEWGGEDDSGNNIFENERPDWLHGPIHDLLVESGVDLVIHGHDHFCGVQQWDGIMYVECPQPMDRLYSYGYMEVGEYTHGDLLPNSGHIRFRVTPDDITVEYVRAFLRGEGVNGLIALSRIITDRAVVHGDNPGWSGPELRISPNPASGLTTLLLFNPPGKQDLKVLDLSFYDISGRLRARMLPQEGKSFVWNQRDSSGRPVPSGVYYCIARYRGGECKRPLVVIR